MVKIVDLYDRETGDILKRKALTAQEAVANAPSRYSLKRPSVWPPQRSASAVERAADRPPPSGRAVPAGAGNRPGRPKVKQEHDGPFAAIVGIGPKLEQRLITAGIADLQALADSTAQAVADALKLPGKSARVIAEERWIEQAQELLAVAAPPPEPAETASAPAQPGV